MPQNRKKSLKTIFIIKKINMLINIINFPSDSIIWNSPYSASAVSLEVRSYLANQRQGTSKAKTRGEVRGSTKKIHRQKGTGRARHGSRYANLFRGGGVTHGPTGKENYHFQINKKVKKRALQSILRKKSWKQRINSYRANKFAYS